MSWYAAIFHGRRWERCILALLALAVGYQVLCEPIVGTADNSDFHRVMAPMGVHYIEDRHSTTFYNLQRKFGVGEPQHVDYLTSQTAIGRSAVMLNRLVFKDGQFDIRSMGVTNALLYLGAIWTLLVAFARRSNAVRLVVGGSALVFFSDVRIVAYFNSFFSESAQVIFLVATLGFALLANQASLSARTRWSAYVAFLVSTVAFCVAKSQDLTFVPSLAVVAYAFMPSKRPLVAVRLAVALAIVAIVPAALLSDAYALTRGVNARVTMEEEILAHSSDPARDLQEIARGKLRKATLGRIAKFYVRHPDRWWSMAVRRTRETHSYVEFGNFERPRSGLSQDFDEWSELKRQHYPRSLPWWIVSVIAYAALLAVKWRKHDTEREARNQTILHLALLAGCIAQFIVVITFEANGTEKHFFIFNVLADLMLVFAVLDVVAVGRLESTKALALRIAQRVRIVGPSATTEEAAADRESA